MRELHGYVASMHHIMCIPHKQLGTYTCTMNSKIKRSKKTPLFHIMFKRLTSCLPAPPSFLTIYNYWLVDIRHNFSYH